MPLPLQALRTDIAMQLAIRSRGMANSLNPLDHSWNFDSATVAKHRLRAVVRSDREVCQTARWRLRPSYFGSKSYLAKAQLEMLAGREALFCGKRVTREELSRMRKPRYRWEVRR